MASSDFLVMRGIRKSFDGTQALKGVDFSARLGEVHAIVGENGAGKSTLMKILAGALQRDGGEILLDGAPVAINSPLSAHRLGIRAVYQEFSLVRHLNITENILMGQMPTGRFKHLDCDTVIVALGTKANPVVARSTPGLTLNKWGNIAADDGKPESTQATNLQGVFAGGDIVTGGATVILAMGAGRRAAKSIATYLASGKKWPITAEDVAKFEPMKALGPSSHAHAGATATGAEAPAMKCPKCHQPIEGDEEYICCATAKLEWRCDDCGKVSEGFAFPYGMCPACGGKLKVLDPRKIEEANALEAIRIAFEIELGGQAFYTRAAKESADPILQELFSKFSNMEKEHMATLSRRYHAQIPTPSQDFKVDRAAIYAGIPNKPEDPANLFRIAIAFEQRAVKFFEQQAGKTPEASVERQLYKELAAEEREHVALLTTELERWKAGKPGLM